jgi:hypothetical protein
MKTITSRSDYNDLAGRARSIAESHLENSDFKECTLHTVRLDEEMSCDMSVSYFFHFSHRFNDKDHQLEGYVTFFANGTHMVQLEPEAEEEPPHPDEWHVHHGDYGDALIYTLREDGFRRGKPVLVNDVMIRIEPANQSKTDISPIVNKVLAALN